jgi:hypothetical protein
MSLTISLYNHTARLFAAGTVQSGNLTVKLYTSATFNAENTTAGSVVATEVVNGNGYTSGGIQLLGVAASTITTNDAMLNGSPAIWIAGGGPISASYAIIWGASNSPLAFIDFGETRTAANGNEFRIEWNSGGIFTFTVA